MSFFFNDRLLVFYTLKAALNIAKTAGAAAKTVEIGTALAISCADWGLRDEFYEIKRDVELALPLAIIDKADFEEAIQKSEGLLKQAPQQQFDPITMCLALDLEDNWSEFGQRPILRYAEGRKAKELYENSDIGDAFAYMISVAETSITEGHLDLADVMLDCLISLMLDRYNWYLKKGDYIACDMSMCIIEDLLKDSMRIELTLNRADRLAQTLGMMAQLFRYFPDYDEDQGLFIAELTLCMGFDEGICWQMCHAAKLAASISFEKGLLEKSKKYCRRFFDIIEKNPNATEKANIDEMHDLYRRLVEK